MIVYAVIMFLAAAVFAVVTVLIYNGKTELIHDYHQTNVKDKAAYGKAFGKAMAVIPSGMTLSGSIALPGENMAWVAVTVLLLGIGIGLIAIFRVQKKYNGGMFG